MNIRASMLPSYPDCPRRGAAKQFRRKFEKLGYEFRQNAPGVGAVTGTATHTSTEAINRAKWAGQPITLDDALTPAFEDFAEETNNGCIWDNTTPNTNVAQQQIKRMTAAYLYGYTAELMPLTVEIEGKPAPAVELALEASTGGGFILTGHIDLVTAAGWVRDTKTGALVRPYHAQLGGYSLLVRSNQVLPIVNGAAIDFIKRCPKTKPQDPAVEFQYPVATSERVAASLVERIKKDMAIFDETGDLNAAFMANTMSMMCGDKYCPAWGTSFCELSGGK